MKLITLLLMTTLLHSSNSDMKLLYLKNACASCHGIYGEGIGASPRLQGVREQILLTRLKNLQAGKPRTAFGTIMVSFAQVLDENQTIEMAKYLSNLKTIIPDEKYEMEDSEEDGAS